MAEINVIDRAGVRHTVDATPGEPLMYALRDAGLGIEASCGGCCICATCHVFLDENWPQEALSREFDEGLLLEELINVAPTSRLACQITITEAMAGSNVRIAPEEL
tara:strand:+ start:100571 stop:100888 length:318 start_codon:yes stop_codon:yes gene_type:complete